MSNFNYKLENELIPKINKIQNIIILELGVQKGRSTIKFLELCKKNNGKLFSVDIDDCSNVSDDKNWTFLRSRDDNFDYIKSVVPNKIDVLFIDTLHEAEHVKNLLYNYFPLININGYIFIDDISHLPYLKDKSRNNFYCEINNKETFEGLLSIYSKNDENFELNFSFIRILCCDDCICSVERFKRFAAFNVILYIFLTSREVSIFLFIFHSRCK